MLVRTKYFGEVDIEESKILTFEHGIFGFEECRKYTLLYNNEKDRKSRISWLQSVEEQSLALPVITPDYIKPDYDPIISEQALEALGDFRKENLIVLLTVTVPTNIEDMTSNLKAPFLVDMQTKKGCQAVAENQDYVVKYKIYDLLKQEKANKGE